VFSVEEKLYLLRSSSSSFRACLWGRCASICVCIGRSILFCKFKDNCKSYGIALPIYLERYRLFDLNWKKHKHTYKQTHNTCRS